MSLRILFADDSVTAQNMGKKILTEAGYDVVAVSNGAAAVKKIAEQKPDIIILDLYMPGYSGLEVCEKVRASIATVKTPVLLTVGKMEPYKPEDANRVRADGVIIKPFEASDLLSIVKKFEERIAQALAAAPPPPPPAVPEVAVATEQHFEQPEPAPPPLQPMVEVPDHMATASAFSDLLGSDVQPMDRFNVATPQRVPETKPSSAAVAAASLPDYDIPVSWREPQPEPEPEQVPEAAAAEPAPAEEPAAVLAPATEPVAAPVPWPQSTFTPQETSATPSQETIATRPRLIPVFQEPAAQAHDFMPTAASPIGDIDIPREPQLQETAEEATRNTIADAREPGLLPTLHQPQQQAEAEPEIAEFTPGSEPPAPDVVQAAAAVAPPPPEPVKEAAEMDFESRVAAAMAAYSSPPEPSAALPIAEPAPAATHAATAVAQATTQAGPVEVSQPPLEHQPSATVEADHHESLQVREPAQTETAPPAEPEVRPEDIAAKIEKELPAAAAAAATEAGAEHHETIAQAVHRVMERVKGDLVDEILRELKSKK